MDIAMICLGKMDAKMAQRLMHDGQAVKKVE
jgi:6-phosphogluconate dehydrogenase (decarboxylating)